jgi:tight adherence protein B
MTGAAVAATALLISGLLHSVSCAALSASTAMVVPVVLRSRSAARHRTEIESEVPAVLTALAAELRAGRPLAVALATVGRDAAPALARRLAAAAAAVERGVDATPVLLAAGDDTLVGALRPLASAISLAGSGARLATVVDRLAAATRADTRVHDAVRAELAGPTASAALLGALPFAGLALATATGGDPLARLATSSLGLVSLLAGIALDGAGLLWARHIVRSVTPRW